jgi:hypothetical protein
LFETDWAGDVRNILYHRDQLPHGAREGLRARAEFFVDRTGIGSSAWPPSWRRAGRWMGPRSRRWCDEDAPVGSAGPRRGILQGFRAASLGRLRSRRDAPVAVPFRALLRYFGGAATSHLCRARCNAGEQLGGRSASARR